MRRIKTRIVALLLVCCSLTVSMLFYFMVAFEEKKHVDSKPVKSTKAIILGFSEARNRNETIKENFVRLLESKLNSWDYRQLYTTKDKKTIEEFTNLLKEDLKITKQQNGTNVWSIAKKWVRARQTIPKRAPELGSVLYQLQNAKIIKSDVSRKGTQLKLLLTLEGGQFALFKPKHYSRDYITDDIYSGADRHNGEIVSFHLSRVLNMRYSPIVASRIINVTSEIRTVASSALLKTFVTQPGIDNRTKDCFYGECYYCNEYNLICPDDNGLLEGAIILMLPIQYQIHKLRHPWQRTYKKNVKAQWEIDSNFCLSVSRINPIQQRMLDFVDTSIFDYLIGNADRHHYEVFKDVSNSALLLIDNGKSFGNPSHDEITILFPLLQCCTIRNSTFHHLKMLSSLKLSSLIENLLSDDILWPLLTDPHLKALDRRLISILASIEICFNSFNKNFVLKA